MAATPENPAPTMEEAFLELIARRREEGFDDEAESR
jgi:hypothetical protein